MEMGLVVWEDELQSLRFLPEVSSEREALHSGVLAYVTK